MARGSRRRRASLVSDGTPALSVWRRSQRVGFRPLPRRDYFTARTGPYPCLPTLIARFVSASTFFMKSLKEIFPFAASARYFSYAVSTAVLSASPTKLGLY